MFRRRNRLTYVVPRPTGMAAMTDALARISGQRCSVAEWERACRASMFASRDRRRAERPPRWPIVLGVVLPVASTAVAFWLALR